MRRLLFLLLLVLTGCYTAPTPPPIVVGHVADKTRPDKAGEQAERGIRLALNELNKEGALTEALGGRSVQVRHTDTRGDIDAYEAEAVRLVSINRAVALLGGLTPEETAALDHAQVPVLTFQGQQVAGGSNQVFYLGLTPTAQGEALGKVVAENAKIQRIVVCTDERRRESAVLTEAFAKAWTDATKKDKTSEVMTLRFSNDLRWTELVERARAHDPQAILFAGTVKDFNAWHRAYRQELFPAEPMLIYGGEDGAGRLFDIDSTAKAKIVLATAFVPDNGIEKTQAFLKAYREAFKSEPDVHAALAYDGFRLLADALKRVHPLSLTSERLRTALLDKKDFDGVTGPLKIAADRQVQSPLFVATWHQGTLTIIKKVP